MVPGSSAFKAAPALINETGADLVQPPRMSLQRCKHLDLCGRRVVPHSGVLARVHSTSWLRFEERCVYAAGMTTARLGGAMADAHTQPTSDVVV